jgi:nitrite reductase/ring-hydroxylating ferredoxin subunit
MVWKATQVKLADLPLGGMREVDLDGHPVLLIHHMEQVFATAGRCPHAGGVLAEGKLQGNRIVCPRHNSTFDVTSGIVLQGPYGAMKTHALAVYHTKVEDGEIHVDLP